MVSTCGFTSNMMSYGRLQCDHLTKVVKSKTSITREHLVGTSLQINPIAQVLKRTLIETEEPFGRRTFMVSSVKYILVDSPKT